MMIVKYDRAFGTKPEFCFLCCGIAWLDLAVAQYWFVHRDRQEQVKNRMFHVCFVTIFQQKTGCIRYIAFLGQQRDPSCSMCIQVSSEKTRQEISESLFRHFPVSVLVFVYIS